MLAQLCFPHFLFSDIDDGTVYYEHAPPDITLNPMEIRTFQVDLAKGKKYKYTDKFEVFS